MIQLLRADVPSQVQKLQDCPWTTCNGNIMRRK